MVPWENVVSIIGEKPPARPPISQPLSSPPPLAKWLAGISHSDKAVITVENKVAARYSNFYRRFTSRIKCPI